MNFEQYVDRVNFHLERLKVEERPTQQNYVDAWNRQLAAKRMAESFSRRVKRGATPAPDAPGEDPT